MVEGDHFGDMPWHIRCYVTSGEKNLTLKIRPCFSGVNGKVRRLLKMLPDICHDHTSGLSCKTPQGGQSGRLSRKSHSLWIKSDGLRKRLAMDFTAFLGQIDSLSEGSPRGILGTQGWLGCQAFSLVTTGREATIETQLNLLTAHQLPAIQENGSCGLNLT
jgi:hypothetical protein